MMRPDDDLATVSALRPIKRSKVRRPQWPDSVTIRDEFGSSVEAIRQRSRGAVQLDSDA